ncbi:MAG TPA: type II toxin-antitoxin system RelE/ParE family toxin [Caldilineaceae bacterium]|nr:type II toxin-antitoxin system RelE/ParE family toxin [Caldilineaceae bacterium]
MTIRYQLDFRKGVLREIERMPGHLRQRVKRIIQQLNVDPRPAIAEELHDDLQGLYKIKLGDWRVVYRVDDTILVVTVIKVGQKSGPEFYKLLR